MGCRVLSSIHERHNTCVCQLWHFLPSPFEICSWGPVYFYKRLGKNWIRSFADCTENLIPPPNKVGIKLTNKTWNSSLFQMIYLLILCICVLLKAVLYLTVRSLERLHDWNSWPLKMLPVGCFALPVKIYQPTALNIQEEKRPHDTVAELATAHSFSFISFVYMLVVHLKTQEIC